MKNKASLILLILLGMSLMVAFVKQVRANGVPGDLNGDGKVNLADLVTLAWSYHSKPGDLNWNPDADFDLSDEIDLADLTFLAAHWTGS